MFCRQFILPAAFVDALRTSCGRDVQWFHRYLPSSGLRERDSEEKIQQLCSSQW